MICRVFAEVAERWSIRLVLAAVMAALLCPFATHAQGVGKQMLHGHMPPAIARLHLQPTGLLPATNRLHLSIGLPMRNQAALEKLLAEIYDPASTNYHHYLTPAQIADQFGPTEQEYQALIEFVKTNGLTVTATYPNRLLLSVSGSAATVEKVFHVTLRTYHDPVENRPFFAPDAEPSIDFNLPILHVSGLDNYAVARPAGLKKNALKNESAGAAPAAGSGPSSSYMGKDFRAAYAPDVALNGAGQMVGILEFDGYLASDITAYENQAGLPNIPLQNVYINSFGGTPSSDDTEVCLDIEMAIAMATNLSAVVVYEAGSSSDFDAMLNSMASSNQIKQFSSSWGLTGSSTDPIADQTFTNMALQGQSFFQASGDGDAWVNTIWIPGASPYITIVGGTSLTMNGSGASYNSESVWNWGYSPPAWSPNGNGYWGSGGGVSTAYTIPSWQTNLNMTTNQGSTTMRNIPDVALTASGIFVVANNGEQETGVGGTSCAAPLWAGFCALINQQAAITLKSPAGFLNPALYTIGKSANYTADFHDITNGNNFSSVSPTNYPAVPGYDLCTGWGTPNGQNLINAIVPPDALVIVPPNGFNATGPLGGPFSPNSQILLLTNTGASSLNWSLINTSVWLNASSTSGALAAGAASSLTMSLTVPSNSLAIGNYTATVKLTNWNTHVVQALPFSLQVLQPLVVTPTTGFTGYGPVGGPFDPNTENFQLTNLGAASLNWSLINTSAWLNASSAGGTLTVGGSTTVTIALNSIASNLLTGTYSANLWFTNQTQGGVQTVPFGLLVGQALVQNGGFETGDFTGWTLTGNTTYMSVISGNSQFVHSGSFGTAMGPQGMLSYLSQTIPTVAGQSYLLSLWLDSPNIGGTLTPNEFTVTWNGNTVTDMVNIGKIGWTNLQFIVTGTSSGTVLQFGFRDDPYYLGLDDVSLTPIPAAMFQPTTTAKTNNNLKFAWNALTGLVYQVQFKTNLLQTNWLVLKSVTPTNSPATFVDTNPMTGTPQKFYRLLILP